MHTIRTEDRVARRIRGRNTLLAGCGTSFASVGLACFAYLAWANLLPPPRRAHRVYPNPNGYDACVAALSRLPARSREDPWQADLGELRSEVAQARPELAALSAAVRLPYLAPPEFGDSLPYRNGVRLLLAEARLELAAGRPGRAMERALDVVELSVKMGRGAPLLPNLLGGVCVAKGQKAAEQCIPLLSAREAQAAGKRLDTIIAQLPPPSDAIQEERRNALASARDVLTGRSPLASSPVRSGRSSRWWDAPKERLLLFVYPKLWGYSQVDRYWKSLAAELEKPYPQRTQPPVSPPKFDPVLGATRISLASIQSPRARMETYLGLLRVELALRRHQLRQGAYPDSLAQLVPGDLAAVPTDVYSAQPLRYRREGGDYVLYSVGPDLLDDGGKPLATLGPNLPFKGDYVAGKLFPSARVAPVPAVRRGSGGAVR